MRGERTEITCLHCGKTFSWLTSQGIRKHCSRACKSAAAERIEFDCAGCEKRVTVLASQVRGHREYCSKACQLEHKRQKRMQVCEHCGQDFESPHAQRFCSISCRYASGDHPSVIDGRTFHPHYQRWQNMVARCTKPGHPAYRFYGGRGIAVCEDWMTPENFYRYLDDVLGPCPPGHSIDRIDNNSNYEPGNLRWATRSQQSANRNPYTWA